MSAFRRRAQPRLLVIAGTAEFYVVRIEYFLIRALFGDPEAAELVVDAFVLALAEQIEIEVGNP